MEEFYFKIYEKEDLVVPNKLDVRDNIIWRLTKLGSTLAKEHSKLIEFYNYNTEFSIYIIETHNQVIRLAKITKNGKSNWDCSIYDTYIQGERSGPIPFPHDSKGLNKLMRTEKSYEISTYFIIICIIILIFIFEYLGIWRLELYV